MADEPPTSSPTSPKPTLFYRLVGPADELRRKIEETVGSLAEVSFTRETPFMRLRTVDGLPTMVAAFTTDIPSLPNWGEPLLFGPGSIHVAHTEREHIEKRSSRNRWRRILCNGKRLEGMKSTAIHHG